MPRAPSRSRSKAPATVTRAFLFSDLRGFTDFVERHGDSAAADLIRSYRDLVRAEIAKHSGAEVKTEGDSFYLVFESPKGAVDCAVHIQRAAAELAGQGGARPLAIGIGLHAGETVPYDDQFVGSAVNIAARLASKARAGEIVLSDTMRGLVRTAVRYEMTDRGPLKLKGVTERVRAYSVEWRDAPAAAAEAAAAPALEMPLVSSATIVPSAGAAPGQIVCPVVVGRDAERGRFIEHLDLAGSGRGQAVILAGEAGVGKSAFVREALAAAAERGFRILYGATLEADSGLPYAPFVAAIRSGFRGIARDRLGRVLAQAAPDLAQLFPELGKAQRSESTSAAEQHRLSVAFLGLFTTFAADGPVLVVVEDLHWADEASLGLFHYLARELRDSRVLLLGTYRSDEMHRRHPLLRALAGMQRERVVAEIALGRLDREQVRALITATFARTDPGIRVSDEFRDAIYERSEGNPFFTEELLRSLVESGDVYYTPGGGWERKPIAQLRIPGSVREAVRERIDRLSAEAQTTLSAAAVIGLRFPFELVRAVRGAAEAELEAQLKEAMDLQLLVEIGGDEDEYGFRHALTKEVVYDDLLVRERKRQHRAVADALEGRRGIEPGVVAHHLLAAGEAQRALPHLLAAADRALAAGAPKEAAAHYGRAIEAGPPDDQLTAIIERQSEAYLLFDTALSAKAAGEAESLYRERGDDMGRSRALRIGGRARFYGSRFDEALAMTRQAVEAAGAAESIELARALAQEAGLLMAAGRNPDALPIAERAIELGRRLDDPWTLAHALVTKASATRDLERSAPLFAEGRRIAARAGITEAVMRGYNNEALRMIGDARPAAERVAFVEEGLAYGRRLGLERGAVAFLLSQLQTTAWGMGDWETALATADQIPDESPLRVWAHRDRARTLAARQGPRSALAEYEAMERASAVEEGADAPDLGRSLALASAYADVGEARRAREWVARAAKIVQRHPRGARDISNPRGVLGGPATIACGVIALLLDLPEWLDEAEAELRDERPLGEAQRSALRAARSIRAGQSGGAAAALDAAAATYDLLGFSGYFHDYTVTCVTQCLERSLPFGPEWRPVLARLKRFAERVGATYWLEQAARAEAASG